MVVFDDVFVDLNLYSGLVVGSDHRQNLHELIPGTQGVALNVAGAAPGLAGDGFLPAAGFGQGVRCSRRFHG